MHCGCSLLTLFELQPHAEINHEQLHASGSGRVVHFGTKLRQWNCVGGLYAVRSISHSNALCCCCCCCYAGVLDADTLPEACAVAESGPNVLCRSNDSHSPPQRQYLSRFVARVQRQAICLWRLPALSGLSIGIEAQNHRCPFIECVPIDKPVLEKIWRCFLQWLFILGCPQGIKTDQ